MALGIFRHLTLAQLQTLHNDAVALLIEGKNRMVVSAGSGDVNVTKEWNLESKLFWEELNWALERLSPGTYPRAVKRTVLRYIS